MADDDLSEFESIDPLEIHLVGTPANKFAPLMAKSQLQKRGKKMGNKKFQRQLRALRKEMAGASAPSTPSTSRPGVVGVDMAGPGSSTIGNHTPATRVVATFLAGLEHRVTKARAEAQSAGSAMEKMRAGAGLTIALRQRFLGKLVVKENANRNGHGASELIPGASPIFKAGSTFSVGDDDSLRYR